MATNLDHPGVIETRMVHDVHRTATTLLADAAHGQAPPDALDEFRRFVVGMLRHHHHCEDADLWPLITSAAPGLGPALAALTQEHDQLDDALDAVEALDVTSFGDGDRSLIRRTTIRLRDLVHEHLSHEEPVLLPALRVNVSPAAWDGFSQRAVASSPPDGNHLMVALLDDVGSADDVGLVLRHVPPDHRELFPAMRSQAAETLTALRRAAVAAPACTATTRPDNARVIGEFRSQRGRVGGAYDGIPLLLLHTTGARSGRDHVVPLAYRRDGDRLVVLASNGGARDDPAWYRNLTAQPAVTAELADGTGAYRARTVVDGERRRLWADTVAAMPRYALYQAISGRDIPVVVLEPATRG